MAATDKNAPMIPFLPPLKSGAEVDKPKVPGAWTWQNVDVLRRIGEGLDIETAGTAEVDSIPTVWAQPVFFAMAFADDAHPHHKRVVGEWRGLLAMIALKSMLRFDGLKAEEVSEAEESDFMTAANALRPMRILAEETTWERLWVFEYDGRAIGMTSPLTLVCTARSYADRLDSTRVPWFVDVDDTRTDLFRGILNDPVTMKTAKGERVLSDDQRLMLAGWVKKLRAAIQRHPEYPDASAGVPSDAKAADTAKAWANLNKRLQEYLEALVGGKRNVAAVPDVADDENNRYKFDENLLYALMDCPAIRSGEGGNDSNTLIEGNVGGEQPDAKPLYLVSPAIAKSWGVDANSLIVRDTVTLRDALQALQAGDRKDRVTLDGNTAGRTEGWITGDDLFTDRITAIVRPGPAFPGTCPIPGAVWSLGKDEVASAILPLKKGVLAYYDADYLTKHMRIERQGAAIRVKLTVVLSGRTGSDGKPRKTIEVERVYTDAVDYVRGTLPVFDLWPNLRAKDWKAYYCFIGEMASGELMFAPWVRGVRDADLAKYSSDDWKIVRAEAFPEAVTVASKEDYAEVERGLLFLQPPKPVENRGDEWLIGIDFGSTCTNVYVTSSDAPKRRLMFQNRTLSITATAAEVWGPLRYDVFVPGIDIPLPIFTLLRVLPGLDERKYLLRGTIKVIDSQSYVSFSGSETELKTNLKWETSINDAIPFLDLVGMFIAVEVAANGVSKVKINYAFPTSFSKTRREQLGGAWGGMVKGLKDECGIVVEPPDEFTESYAAASYFYDHPDHKGAVRAGAAFFDIGGSTVDVSVWQEKRLVWQGSLRIAGRDLLLDTIIEQPQLLRGLLSQPESVAKLDAVAKMGLAGEEAKAKTRAYAVLDAVLRVESEKIAEKLVGKATTVQPMVHEIAVGMAGIVYYTGLVLRHKKEKGEYNPVLPDLHFGGNGSRMLHWLSYGSFSEKKVAAELLRTMLMEASGLDLPEAQYQIKITSNPKDEVAYGLIVEPTLDARVKDIPVIAGESYSYRDEAKDWGTFLTAEQLSAGVSVSGLDMIGRFIESYNGFLEHVGDTLFGAITSRTADVAKETNEQLGKSDYRGKKAAEIDVDPLFIIALKSLVTLERKKRHD